MNCLLIRISLNKRGLPVRSYRTLNAEELMIGRGAECNIHLLDPRIAMHHAVIKRLNDGKIHLVAINGELQVDGVMVNEVTLTDGQQAMIGPYLLKVEPAPPDVNISVSLELSHRLPDDFQDLKARTHEPLQGASSVKRKIALGLFAFITFIFLALPLAQNLSPRLHTIMEDLPMGFDRLWSPGHISNAHLHFGSQCFNCHEKLTQRVSDTACLTCHQDTAPHIANASLQKQVFSQKHLFSDGIRCAECHREHKAPVSLTRQDNAKCVACHGNIKAVDAKTALSNVHDFDKDHPPFKLTFISENQQIERISQTEKDRLVEQSGLIFPHSQHVGKVQGPNGMDDVRDLTCTNCHRPEGKEMRFSAPTFERDCKTCHRQELKLGSTDKVIYAPHGSVQQVVSAIQTQAPKQAAAYLESLKTEGCAYCHEVLETQKEEALPWKIKPLTINHDWFSKAHFNHAKHRTQQCQACHDVETSETSEDVAMPDKAVCLKCHSGNKPKYKRIASTCMSCHEFHDAHATKAALLKK